jgi:hypothetical protein
MDLAIGQAVECASSWSPSSPKRKAAKAAGPSAAETRKSASRGSREGDQSGLETIAWLAKSRGQEDPGTAGEIA